MDKLVKFLSRQLPAFWGLILITPLIRDHLPNLHCFILTDKLNTALVIGCWLIVFEMAVYHIMVPIVIVVVSFMGTLFGVQLFLIYKFPKIGHRIWKIWRPRSVNLTDADPRKAIAIKLICSRFRGYGDLPDYIALTMALQLGSKSKYFEEAGDKRSSEVFAILAITSFIAAIVYWSCSPDLSIINISWKVAVIVLFISAVFLTFCAYIMNWDEGNLALNAVLLELTESVEKERNTGQKQEANMSIEGTS